MNTKTIFTFFLTALATLQLNAQVRTQAQLQAAAQRALGTTQAVQVQRQGRNWAIVGNAASGSAIVARSSALPAVIGRTDQPVQPGTPLPDGLQWCLDMLDRSQAPTGAARAPRKAVNRIDTTRFKPYALPMLTTSWGQNEPYNNLCPDNSATGCMATALAQILRYQHDLSHGQGARTIWYPFADTTGRALSVDFAATTAFDWNNMLDNYTNTTYTPAQAQAVAKLMYYCGVISNMNYDGAGSGSFVEDTHEGLLRWFDLPLTARLVSRADYLDQPWADIVYGELSAGRPILYGGLDFYRRGHAFVLDGYAANGNVHVNWGWNGGYNGFFDMTYLLPSKSMVTFDVEQQMVVGIQGQSAQVPQRTVNVATPGTLSAVVGQSNLHTTPSLKVTGALNSTDLLTLRLMAGRDRWGQGTEGGLTCLDLSEATLVAGGEPYYKDLTLDRDSVLPEQAFSYCEGLNQLKLPRALKGIGAGALDRCLGLVDVEIPAAGSEFVNLGGVVYSADTTVLLTASPTLQGPLTLAPTTRQIAPHALAGCSHITRVDLPEALTAIGNEAFAQNNQVRGIYNPTAQMPATESGTFNDLSASCYLYVRPGQAEAYEQHTGAWRHFSWNEVMNAAVNHVREYGTLIIAHDQTRDQGQENPELTYAVTGDPIHGAPLLTTTAMAQSPVGTYPIVVERGSIEETLNVWLQDGTLTVVTPAKGKPGESAVNNVAVDPAQTADAAIYSIDGRLLGTGSETLKRLPRGIYITAGQKVVK